MTIMASAGKRHLLLTGPPGIGKTTLVIKVSELLGNHGISTTGFYTEEIRERGRRIGFDVVSLKGQRSALARVNPPKPSQCQVGQYHVDLASFESTALPSLRDQAQVVVIDEVGKMELFSRPFQSAVREVFQRNKLDHVLATIPIAKGRPLPSVEELRNRSDTEVIVVSRENRDDLADLLFKRLLSSPTTAKT